MRLPPSVFVYLTFQAYRLWGGSLGRLPPLLLTIDHLPKQINDIHSRNPPFWSERDLLSGFNGDSTVSALDGDTAISQQTLTYEGSA
jgi:hypothetical protein